MSQKNNSRKNNRNNYKIESLEPRLLMDASDANLDRWDDELSCISAPSLWTDVSKLKSMEEVDLQIDGLYKKDVDSGSMTRARLSDLVEFDSATNKGLSLADTDDILNAIRNRLNSTMKDIAASSAVTADKLNSKIGKGVTFSITSDESSYYGANISYKVVDCTNGKITIGATADVYLKSGFLIGSYIEESNNEALGKTVFCADLSETSIGIASDFSFDNFNKTLEFTFTLDGNDANGVDLNSTVTYDVGFNQKGNAQYGVLGLSGDTDSKIDLKVETVWKNFFKQGSENNNVNSDIAADLTFKVVDADKSFLNDIPSGKFTFTKNIGDKTGKWNGDSELEKFNKFSMDKVISKFKEVSFLLSEIQSGNYKDNNVDFAMLLSQNAHSLVNLSAMLNDVINNPPQTLQQLADRLKNSSFAYKDSNTTDNDFKISISENGISIPVQLHMQGDVKDVYLSQSTLEELLSAKVLKNQSIQVQSEAGLKFKLVIPFAEAEMASAKNALYELGLNGSNTQMSSIIGGKAFVGQEMGYFLDGNKDIATYATSVATKMSNAGFGAAANSSNQTYVLYRAWTSAQDNPVDLSSYAEFKGASASKGYVFQWKDSWKQITYKNVTTEKKTRDVSNAQDAVNSLNALFAQSKNDEVKSARAVAYGNLVIILSDSTELINDFKENLKFGDSNASAFIADNLAMEVWESFNLSPDHYNTAAQMTITVGNESHDLNFVGGFFNSALSVSDIATSLQETINNKFHWTNETSRLIVENNNGAIRFVALDDYLIDFHNEKFAEWLGFSACTNVIGKGTDAHVFLSTSSDLIEKAGLNVITATTAREKDTSLKFEEVEGFDKLKGFDLVVTIGSTQKTIHFEKDVLKSEDWGSNIAVLLQEKIDKAFGWDEDSSKIYVSSINDQIRFGASECLSITTDELLVAKWLGFTNCTERYDDGSSRVVISSFNGITSSEIDEEIFEDFDESVTMAIVYDDGVRREITFDSADISQLESVEEWAALIQKKINDSSVSGESEYKLKVSCKDGKLSFNAHIKFSIGFSNEALFGFADNATKASDGLFYVNNSVDFTNKDFEDLAFTNYIKTTCMEVYVENGSKKMDPIVIDLSSILTDGKLENAKDCTVGEILNRIVAALNAKMKDCFKLDGVTLVSQKDGVLITEIRDVNGYSIASMLGLTGIYGKNLDEERGSFFVQASLVDDAIKDNSKVPLFKDFNLNIVSRIVDGKIDLPVQYGVFGQHVTGDITGMHCISALNGFSNDGTNLIRLNKLGSVINDYYTSANGKWDYVTLSVSVDPGVNNSNSKCGVLEFGYNGNELKCRNTPWHSFNKKDDAFGNYSKNELCAAINERLCGKLQKQFFADNCTSKLSNVDLPIIQQSIMDLIGFQSVLNKLSNYLQNEKTGSNLQEICENLANKTGLSVTANCYGALQLDFSWSMAIDNKLVELNGLEFGQEDLRLNGAFKAYLTANVKFNASIVLSYNQQSGKIIATIGGEGVRFEGSVTLKAQGVNTDLEISSYENGELKKTSYKVQSLPNSESNILIAANLNGDDSFTLHVGGKLHVYRNGAETGVIQIKIAQQNEAWNAATAWDGTNDAVGRISCSATPSATIALKNSDGTNTVKNDSQNARIVLDMTGIDNLELESVDLYDLLREAADALGGYAQTAKDGIASATQKLAENSTLTGIPFLEDRLDNLNEALDFLEEKFIEPFRKFAYTSADKMNALVITEKLATILNTFIAKDDSCLAECSETSPVWWAQKQFTNYYKGIQFYESENEAYWHIRLQVKYDLAKDAGFDLGLPGLGLKGDGGIDLGLDLVLDFGFGISKEKGAFLLLSNGYEEPVSSADDKAVPDEQVGDAHSGDDIVMSVYISPAAKIKGSLHYLTLEAIFKNNNGIKPIVLGIDLNDGGKKNHETLSDDIHSDFKAPTLIYFNELLSKYSLQANVRGQIDLQADMILGLGSYGEQAPHIDSGFRFKWGAEFGDATGKLQALSFDGIVLDCGSVIEHLLGPIIDNINRVLDPIRPLIRFLQSEVPVLNKLPAGKIHITVLDLIKKFGEKEKMDFGLLDDIIKIDSFVKTLDELMNVGISIGDWDFLKEDKLNSKDKENQLGMDYLLGKLDEAEKFIDETFKGGTTKYVLKNGTNWEVSTEGEKKVIKPEFDFDWYIPILRHPIDSIQKLMTGKEADLFVFDLKPLKFEFDWSKSFPIIGPLCADIGFGFGVDIDLYFGYDTYGFKQFLKTSDPWAFIDGFYIGDTDRKTGIDNSEIIFHSCVVGGASIGGRIGVSVGLNLNLDLDFRDLDGDGRIHFSEIKEIVTTSPLTMFNVSSSINARAYAYLDYFIGRKEWTLWSSGAFELFNTANYNSVAVATTIGNDLVVSIGEYAENSNFENFMSDNGKDEVEITIKDSKKAEINVITAGGKNTTNQMKKTYTVSGDNLCIYAGKGNDKITIKCSKDVKANFNIIVYGGKGNDQIDLSGVTLADGFYALVVGCEGDDYIAGASGKEGTNYLFGDNAAIVYENDDKKKIKTVAAYLTEDETAGDDFIVGGTKSKNIIFGGDGYDFLVGGEGESYIFGDFGRLTIDGETKLAEMHDINKEGGIDLIYGGNGVDHIYAGAGNDLIDANGGNDEIYGGRGNDVIYGGSGDDSIFGNTGSDAIFGDAPSTGMIIASSLGLGSQIPYSFIPSEIIGTLDCRGESTSPLFVRTETREHSIYDQIQAINLASFFMNRYDWTESSKGKTVYEAIQKVLKTKDTLAFGSDYIDGGDGDDLIFGDDGRNEGVDVSVKIKGGNDIILGGTGNDVIDGDFGNDQINGGNGSDLIYGGMGDDTLDGGAGNDFIFGDDGKVAYGHDRDETGKWFNQNGTTYREVFGDTIDAVGRAFGISNITASTKDGGNDTIIAGNGSDFVDGQNGDDTYNVQFMGGSENAFTNVMDSGNDTGDTMRVIGTLENDFISVRASDAGLGIIARTTDSSSERVNYWKNGTNRGIDSVSLETRAGSDYINVDSTLTAMTIDAGSDDDNIQIGVNYSSNATSLDNALEAIDSSLIQMQYGYLSAGNQHAMTVKGGSGDDVFYVNHTNAALTLFGTLGDDTFNIKSYVDNNLNPVINHGQIAIYGSDYWYGSATIAHESNQGTVNIYGLPISSKYMIAPHHVLTTNLDVTYAAIYDLNVYGSEEQDSFYCYDSALINQHVDGNGGNDLLFKKGLANFSDQKFAMILPSGATEKAVAAAIIADSQKIESSSQVILTDAEGNVITDIPYLNAESGSVKYGIKLSKKPSSEKVVIRVMVPNASIDDQNRDVRSVTLNGKSYVDLTFTADNYNKIQYIEVKVLEDNVYGNVVLSILHDIIEKRDDEFIDCPSVLLWTPGADIYTKNSLIRFKETLQYKISDCTYNSNSKTYTLKAKINSNFAETKDLEKIFDLSVNGKTIEPSSIILENGYLTVSFKNDSYKGDQSVCIAFESAIRNLNDESKVSLNYLESALYDSYGNYSPFGLPTFLLTIDGTDYTVSHTRDTSIDGYFYKIQGNQAIICSNVTGAEVTVTGTISFVQDKTAYVKTGMEYNYLSYRHNTNGDGWSFNNIMESMELAIDCRDGGYFVSSPSSNNTMPFLIKVDVPEGKTSVDLQITVIASELPDSTWVWLDKNGETQSKNTEACISKDVKNFKLDIKNVQCELGAAYIYLNPSKVMNGSIYVKML